MRSTGSDLTERQSRVLLFLREYARMHGYPPSIRDIQSTLHISSTSVVDYNLGVLERKGHIRRTRDVSRGIELLDFSRDDDSPRMTDVPVVGQIAAGQPIEAVEGDVESVHLSSSLAPEGTYALRVKGKSMIEDLIDDGDLVIVKRQATADNGDIVVALLNDSPTGNWLATLKRLYREKDRIRLQPANATMAPIWLDPARVQVQGKVIAVLRQLR